MSDDKPAITDASFKRDGPGTGLMTEMTIRLKGNDAGLFVAQSVIRALLRGEGAETAQLSAEDMLRASAERDQLRAERDEARREVERLKMALGRLAKR